MAALRQKAAPIIVSESSSEVTFTDSERDYLLITVPITFRFLKDDVGFSLKRKLLKTTIPKVLKIDWTGVKESAKDDNSSSSDPDTDTPKDNA